MLSDLPWAQAGSVSEGTAASRDISTSGGWELETDADSFSSWVVKHQLLCLNGRLSSSALSSHATFTATGTSCGHLWMLCRASQEQI